MEGKGGRCVGMKTLPLSCADCLEMWGSQPPGTLRACSGLEWYCFTFYFSLIMTFKMSKRVVIIFLAVFTADLHNK